MSYIIYDQFCIVLYICFMAIRSINIDCWIFSNQMIISSFLSGWITLTVDVNVLFGELLPFGCL